MLKKTAWYHSLLNAEKTCLKEDKIKKIHYKLKDGNEMVEEYNTDTEVLLRRAWNIRGKTNFNTEGKWNVEVGDPMPEPRIIENLNLRESQDMPMVTRRNTRVNLEWRIRNLPYPIDTYTISADSIKKKIIVKTSNKKYYKELPVPEFERINIPLVQENINYHHQYSTLVIVYKKPLDYLEMEKEWYKELEKVKPVKDIPNECKTQ